MIREAIALTAVLFMSGCYAPPQRIEASSNSEVNVELMTEFDGCKVYRLWDFGNRVYIARCGQDVRAEWSTSCGKGCTKNNQTLTVEDIP
jgi:hypothetical protein